MNEIDEKVEAFKFFGFTRVDPEIVDCDSLRAIYLYPDGRSRERPEEPREGEVVIAMKPGAQFRQLWWGESTFRKVVRASLRALARITP